MMITQMTNSMTRQSKILNTKKTMIAIIMGNLLSTSMMAQANIEATEPTEAISEEVVSSSETVNSSQEAVGNDQPKERDLDDYWGIANLYENEEGDYLKLSGRLQYDSAWVDSDQGDYDETDWRRFRFGVSGKEGDFKYALEADLKLNEDFGDVYNRLTDANVTWLANDNMSIKVLKQSTGFTLDGRTSSKKLLTLQRNNLTNNLWFTKEYFTGVSVTNKLANGVKTKAGIFSSDGSDEISISDGSYFALLSTSKTFSNSQYWDDAQIVFDYVYNDVDAEGGANNFSQILSASTKFTKNNWTLQSDISWGEGDFVDVDGFEQSNLFGVVIMPSYNLTEEVELVARYTYIESSEDNGIILGRYDNDVVEGRGDRYRETYVGVNWYLNDHKLKLQAGIQYAQMDDNANDGGEYDGWNFTVGFRSYW